MQHPKIAVVGAGPAGLTAAIILSRHGWPVTVFEADAGARSRDQGGTLDLHPDDGQLALSKAGLLEEFWKIARHEDQGERVLDALTGKVLHEETPEPGQGNRPEIDRLALRDLLLSALKAQDVKWNAQVLSVVAHPAGGQGLQLDTGIVGPFDLVIGADGAWSRVRAALTEVLPVYSGVTFVELWLSNVDALHPDIAALVGRGTMFALHNGQGIIAQRNGGGAIRVYAAFHTTPEEGDRPDRTLARINKADLLRRFTGWAPSLCNLIERAERIAAVRPIVALPPGLGWTHQPHLTLVGDAAHVMPPLGTGVNLAMLDAAELAEALVTSEQWQSALVVWEKAMLRRAEILAQQTREGFAEMFSESGQASVLQHVNENVQTEMDTP
ncbi:NAD(P)/FAD-dependent oxidoreductase [Acidipila sp. EB88]|uniref:FAD-dependent oxidoreductase n=1 Tax=Acidipila sp. EB88 TaxID=2305226 RepID=UPI000F60191E|nr:NAD(P)/FAD-dependent oxidoreductase [Acidipila sp. EB88]RRA49842.1 FAD-dependent monooxygenase [Acidipila sp. EB88]